MRFFLALLLLVGAARAVGAAQAKGVLRYGLEQDPDVLDPVNTPVFTDLDARGPPEGAKRGFGRSRPTLYAALPSTLP